MKVPASCAASHRLPRWLSRPTQNSPTVCERKAHIMFNISDHPPRPAVTTPAGRQLLAPVAAVLELSPAEKALYLRRGPAGRAGRVRRWDWACCVVVVVGGDGVWCGVFGWVWGVCGRDSCVEAGVGSVLIMPPCSRRSA